MLNTAGAPSRAVRVLSAMVPLLQLRLTFTLAVLLSLKSLYTVNVSEPCSSKRVSDGANAVQPVAVLTLGVIYACSPGTMVFRTAVHFALDAAPTTLNRAVEFSEACCGLLITAPLVQVADDADIGWIVVAEIDNHPEIIRALAGTLRYSQWCNYH